MLSEKKPLLSVAPMMDWTDKHCRYFLRLIAPDIQLYTEMITVHALMHGDVDYLLAYDPIEHPIALQLGGSDPMQLAHCAALGEQFGYDEINLNVGCPSPRVSAGRFGACLMQEPTLVAECISAMRARVKIPVTIKCRIGVDHRDSYEALHDFIALNKTAGCNTFIIHARKAWLSGLSPKENRSVPPLNYAVVHQVKRDFPTQHIVLNGGLQTIAGIKREMQHIDGVMVGRHAYHHPYWLTELEQQYYPARPLKTREEIIVEMQPYIAVQLQKGVRLTAITRHLHGLYHGEAGARQWRRDLSMKQGSFLS